MTKEERAIYQKAYYAKNKEQKKDYYNKHKEQVASYKKAYYAENREELALQMKAYYGENKEQVIAYQKAYYDEHKEQVAASHKVYRDNNKESIAADKKVYRTNNRERALAYNNTKVGKYSNYKSGAKRRQMEFDLSYEEFESFWQIPCSYCGGEISTVGIDRISSDIGYVKSNCKSCCLVCNMMKSNHTQEFWIDHMGRILAHLNSNQGAR